MLAILDGLEHQFLGHAIAADQFDDDIDVRIGHHGKGVVGNLHLPRCHPIGQLEILVGHRRDPDGAARPSGDFFFIARENGKRAAADGTDAEQAYVDGFHFNGFLKLNAGIENPA